MLNVDDVSKLYGRNQAALSHVSFAVTKGEMIFLTGASGAGKSTLLRLIYREEKPNSGNITLGPFNLSHIAKRNIPILRRHVGVVFQDFRLIPERTAFENVALTLEVVGKSGNEIRKKADDILNQMGIWNKRNNYPHQLSGGEAQRVALARAVINEPLMLLADEPTGNLDEENSRSLLELLLNFNLCGSTIMVATHQVALAAEFGKRILHLDSGVLKGDGK
jgi:cell division transport system ATP-binding protein